MKKSMYQECVAYQLSQAKKWVAVFYQQYLNPLELNINSVYVMNILQELDAATPTQIAHQLGVSKPTVTALLDRMVKAGLIHRENHSENRKVLIISLTKQGKAKCEKAFAALQKADRKIEELSKQNLLSLKSELNKLSDMLAERQ